MSSPRASATEIEEYTRLEIEDLNSRWKRKFIEAIQKEIPNDKVLFEKAGASCQRDGGGSKRVRPVLEYGVRPHLPSQHSGGCVLLECRGDDSQGAPSRSGCVPRPYVKKERFNTRFWLKIEEIQKKNEIKAKQGKDNYMSPERAAKR
ncbi:hypothetical protein BC938DRAFT_478850 [Jimgerdemannia flammicorona]|uniref:Uncharacterized protein n=1 Tax=Jimgerdemannia flammicorona TaxID=994334 RepID=A0A433QY38_9FUNG|nr:hypothetical protein BC938DRAFT_478850 [Jimgerdemannia flammicorona]